MLGSYVLFSSFRYTYRYLLAMSCHVQVHVPVSSCDVMDIVAFSSFFVFALLSSGTLHAYSESHDPS